MLVSKKNTLKKYTALMAACLLSYGCVNNTPKKLPSVALRITPSIAPHYLKKSPYGNPKQYQALGKTYHVLPSATGYFKKGIASWYGPKFNGKLTSTRTIYNMYAMTAASPELPIPCYALVTNLSNQKQVIVQVNDRGPFKKGRILDLSYAAATSLGYTQAGTAPVSVQTLTLRNPNLHSNNRQYIQAGAFSNALRAANQLSLLQKMNHSNVLLQVKKTPGHLLFKVDVGPFKYAKNAKRTLQNLRRAGFKKAYILPKITRAHSSPTLSK